MVSSSSQDMASAQQQIVQGTQEEDKKQSRNRYDHLRIIEKQIQAQWKETKPFEAQAKQGYENMSFQDKNKGKFMVTFPYPYMNGYLHLGHAFSMSKCEFQARFQKQQGKNALFPFSFHCTGMPIQAAAFRLKREISTGKIHKECFCLHPTPEKKCPCPKIQTNQKQDKQAGKKEEIKGGKKEEAPKCTCEKPTQYEILQSIGISEEEIPKFQDPIYWLDFFPPKARDDLQSFGLMTDWRRSFITTEVNPFYDSFIRWQFNILKKKEKLRFGKRYTIFSELDNQPCADHDRSKGENIGPQEYTIIKLKTLEIPDKLKDQFNGKDLFLVAATLRAETMYGQTNCFVLPEGEYGVFEMKNNEYFICTQRSARNMAYQELTKDFGKYPTLATIKGQDLIGTPLKAPLSPYEVVYALPMTSISMTKGTGIVTSVPSDAPDDWATLRDIQTRSYYKDTYKLKEEWYMPYKPISIIDVPEFGNLSAVKLVDDMGIKSQKDKEKLQEAKDKIYLKGFYAGKMLVGVAEGMKVQDAKPLTRKLLFDNNQAHPYYEPESEVVSRTGDQCIVALCDQWFLTYGEEQWKNFVMKHVKSDQFECYNPKTQKEFEETIDWLNEWACSRTKGLGTQVPWDTQFVIESLSDSTIYMAFYTISHFLQGGVLNGQLEGHVDSQQKWSGSLNIKVTDMTPEVWDYIFLRGNYPQGCAIPEEHLQKMRYEFEYWYPMDLRCSGKDLIRNHLTMSLYNHAAIWGDDTQQIVNQDSYKMMPQGFYCNGYVLVNGKKMSKSEGNFLTVRDCIERYGVDATRLTLADSGDGLDDANFDELVANSAILRLFILEKWIKDELKKCIPEEGVDFSLWSTNEYDLWDKIFDNEIDYAIENTTKHYKEIKYKQALKNGFFELQSTKDDYLKGKKGKMNPFLLIKYIETQLILLNPICPHFCEYSWQQHLYPVLQKCKNFNKDLKPDLINMGWPQQTKQFDATFRIMYDYLKQLRSNVNVSLEQAKYGGKKGKPVKKGKKEEEVQEIKKPIDSCLIFVAKEYPEWQKKTIEILQSFEFDDKNKIIGSHIQKIQSDIDSTKKVQALKFASFLLEQAEIEGKEKALEIKAPFVEKELLEINKDFLFDGLNTIKNIQVFDNQQEMNIETILNIPGAKNQIEAALPKKPAVFFY